MIERNACTVEIFIVRKTQVDQSPKLREQPIFAMLLNNISSFVLASMADATRILYSFSILMGWLLQFYVPMQLLGPWLRTLRHRKLSEGALRIGLTLLTCKCCCILEDVLWLLSWSVWYVVILFPTNFLRFSEILCRVYTATRLVIATS